MRATLKTLKSHALASSLFTPATLRRAIERLGFVQADPIRSPARAQDLILRHRVKNYRAGDLERLYPKLGLEEDYLYAYGFMPEATWRLLHPRISTGLSAADRRVLDLVSAQTHLHPRELEAHLGNAREVNAWGGYSKATTRILERLHYRGLLRVSRRENGIRVYEATTKRHDHVDLKERLHKLVLLIAGILQPVPERSLRATLQHLAHAAPDLEGRYSAMTELIAAGELTTAEVEGLRYVWPSLSNAHNGHNSPCALTGKLLRRQPEETVRFLAPFDPLVWDRRRFEHFWGWAYRFEAYTPVSKRKLGYYAMPLLWKHDVIGWVNVSNRGGTLDVDPGYAGTAPKGDAFRRAFEAEVERFGAFLG
jgi:hypothetical protein